MPNAKSIAKSTDALFNLLDRLQKKDPSWRVRHIKENSAALYNDSGHVVSANNLTSAIYAALSLYEDEE